MALVREEMVAAMVGHVLAHGIADASLRPLAKAAGTSDRMLIYHFGSKQQVIGEVLLALARMFETTLSAQVASERPASRAECLALLAGITRSPELRPVMRVWMEILAASAGGETGYQAIGRQIVDQLLGWIAQHLPVDDPAPDQSAAVILAAIEGAVVIDLAGHPEVADAALAGVFA